jgi:hypothetical protein
MQWSISYRWYKRFIVCSGLSLTGGISGLLQDMAYFRFIAGSGLSLTGSRSGLLSYRWYNGLSSYWWYKRFIVGSGLSYRWYQRFIEGIMTPDVGDFLFIGVYFGGLCVVVQFGR